jgi:hypothetical protein
MKHLFLSCLLFSLLPVYVKAQVENIMLTGHISVSGGEAFAYTLVFSDSANILTGYSVTTQGGDYEAKATIVGRINPASHTLTFKETGIIYTHGTQTGGLMCLVAAELTYTLGSGGHILRGSFSGSDMGNAICGTGTITFTNSNNAILSSLFSATAAVAEAPAQKKPQGIVVMNDVPERPAAINKITAGMERMYEWHNNTVIIDVWDGGNIDGDVITLLYNNTPVLAHYTLTRDKKQLRLPLSGNDVNVVAIVAENEGSEPPNTASMTLTDGDVRYNILAYDKVGQQALIKIKRAGK